MTILIIWLIITLVVVLALCKVRKSADEKADELWRENRSKILKQK